MNLHSLLKPDNFYALTSLASNVKLSGPGFNNFETGHYAHKKNARTAGVWFYFSVKPVFVARAMLHYGICVSLPIGVSAPGKPKQDSRRENFPSKNI
jgi:hypothetical protein